MACRVGTHNKCVSTEAIRGSVHVQSTSVDEDAGGYCRIFDKAGALRYSVPLGTEIRLKPRETPPPELYLRLRSLPIPTMNQEVPRASAKPVGSGSRVRPRSVWRRRCCVRSRRALSQILRVRSIWLIRFRPQMRRVRSICWSWRLRNGRPWYPVTVARRHVVVHDGDDDECQRGTQQSEHHPLTHRPALGRGNAGSNHHEEDVKGDHDFHSWLLQLDLDIDRHGDVGNAIEADGRAQDRRGGTGPAHLASGLCAPAGAGT